MLSLEGNRICQTWAAGDTGIGNTLHHILVTSAAYLVGLVRNMQYASGLPDGVAVVHGHLGPFLALFQTSPQNMVRHLLLVAAYPAHVYTLLLVHMCRVYLRYTRFNHAGAYNLQYIGIAARVGGIVHRAYLIIYILLVHVHRQSVYVDGIAKQGVSVDFAKHEHMCGIVGISQFIVVGIVRRRCPCQFHHTRSIVQHLIAQVLGSLWSLHVHYTHDVGQRIAYVLCRVVCRHGYLSAA